MKTSAIIPAVASCVALAASAVAAPVPASADCAPKMLYPTDQHLKITSESGELLSYLFRHDLGPAGPISALDAIEVSQKVSATQFNLQLSDAPGFAQGSSRNHGGSMGAPLEYWGLVSAPARYGGVACLQRQDQVYDYAEGEFRNVFMFETCNEQSRDQWFRLQRGTDGDVLDFFPYAASDFKPYQGQTRMHMGAVKERDFDFVRWGPNSFGQTIKFDA